MKKRKNKEEYKSEGNYTVVSPEKDYENSERSINSTDKNIENSVTIAISKSQKRFPSITVPVICVLFGILFGILFSYGGNPLVSLVNGQPIFRWELANILLQQYGRQTLEGMILERLVNDEAKKLNIQVTQDDIDKKLQQILQQFGGDVKVEDFLKFQGIQKQEFDNQIKLQLMIERLVGKDIQITDEDVTRYIATNQGRFVSTDAAVLREEAKSIILNEKISRRLPNWLEELKRKANIQNFF
ncbi:MAG: SurA N-terminal domain-containing protein [Patescibacteria group bacterium]|nr:SurA N-terminal domain-containing protein [Patescibacteria group bacterium]